MARRRNPRRAKPAPEKAASARKPVVEVGYALPFLFGAITFAIIAVAIPEYGKWVGVAVIVALALFDWARRLLRGAELSFDVADLILLGLIAYGALSLLWSVNVGGGVQTVIIASAGLLLSAYLKRFATQSTMTAICYGIGWGVLCAPFTNIWLPADQWWGYGNRGYLAEALTLSVPFMWPLWCRKTVFSRGFAALVTLVALSGVFVMGAFVPATVTMVEPFVIATFAAIASVSLCFRTSARLGWACAAAWLLLPPIVAWFGWDALYLTDRLLVRTELWVNSGFMIWERPLFGYGAGSFIEVYPFFKEAHGDWMPFVNRAFQSYVTEAEAAHNEPVQLLVELGVVGLLPFLAYVGIVLRASVRRMAADPFAAAGGAALVAVLAESLLEYPFQRCATMFLAVLAVSMAGHGNPMGLRRWRLALPVPARYALAPLGAIAAILLVFASYRQYEAEARLDATHRPGLDPVAAFNITWEAHRLDPLDRRILTSLPVYLDGVLHAHGIAYVGQSLVDQVYREVDRDGRNNTAALVAHAQYLLSSPHDDPEFPKVLADLKHSSGRVAAAYAIEARYQFLHGQFAAALATATEGLKFADIRASVPTADEAIQKNLEDLQRAAQAQVQLQALQQHRQQLEQQQQQLLQSQQQPKVLVPQSQ